jgi:hypothetical protein
VKYHELAPLQNKIMTGGAQIPGAACNRQLVKGEIISSLSLLGIREFNKAVKIDSVVQGFLATAPDVTVK